MYTDKLFVYMGYPAIHMHQYKCFLDVGSCHNPTRFRKMTHFLDWIYHILVATIFWGEHTHNLTFALLHLESRTGQTMRTYHENG